MGIPMESNHISGSVRITTNEFSQKYGSVT